MSQSALQGSMAMLAEIESGELLQKQLQNAFDVSKIFSVFETFLKVIKEQQQEILQLRSDVSASVDRLNEQSRQTNEKLREAEEKIALNTEKILNNSKGNDESVDVKGIMGIIDERCGEAKSEAIDASLLKIEALRAELSDSIAGVKSFCIDQVGASTKEQIDAITNIKSEIQAVAATPLVVVDEQHEMLKMLELQEMKKDIVDLKRDIVVAAEAAAMPHVITNQIVVDDTASTKEIEKINENIHMIDENFKMLEPKFEHILVELNKDRTRIDSVLADILENRQRIEKNQAFLNKNLENILTEINKDRVKMGTAEKNLAEQGDINSSVNDKIYRLEDSVISILKRSADGGEEEIKLMDALLPPRMQKNIREESSGKTDALSSDQIRIAVSEILCEFNINRPLVNLHLLEDLDGLMRSKLSSSTPAMFSQPTLVISDNSDSVEVEFTAEIEIEERVRVDSPMQLLEKLEPVNKKRDRMDVNRLMLVSSHKRRELMGWLKVKGRRIIKDKDRMKLERDQLLSVPEKLKGLETELANMNQKLLNQEKITKNFDKLVVDKIRASLPDGFNSKFPSISSMLSKIDDHGGVDQLFRIIKLLQSECSSISKHIKDSADDIKIFTTKKDALSEPFLRLIKQQIGPCEPDSDSNTMIDIINRIHKVNEEAVRLAELDEILEFQREESRIVNRRYEKLRETIENVCQAMLTEYTKQSVGLQVKIDPKEFKQLLKEAESYTNQQMNNVSANISQTYDDKIKKLEDVKLSSLHDNIKKLEYEQFQLRDKFDMMGKTYNMMTGGANGGIGGKLTVGPSNSIAPQHIEEAIKSHVQAFAEDVRYQKEKEKEVFRQMSDQVIQLQTQLETRPDKDNVKEMIGFLETAFKRRFGGDMSNLRTTVTQIVKAVQEKAGREEVASMIADKVTSLEEQMSGTLMEDNSKISVATKCIACGQPSMYRTRTPGTGLGNPLVNHGSVRAISPLDDDRSINSLQSMQSMASLGGRSLSSSSSGMNSHSSPSAPQQAAQFIKNFYDISEGKVGLKPLLNQSPPFDIKQHPMSRSSDLASMPGQQQVMRKSPYKGSPNSYNINNSNNDRITTPLYQKARVSSHMKELVKQHSVIPTSQSTQMLYQLEQPGHGHSTSSSGYRRSIEQDDNASQGSQGSSQSLPQLYRSPNRKNGY